MKIRAVLDTNILVSGFLFGGPPRDVIRLAVEKRFEIALSNELMDELTEVLRRPKFRVKRPPHALILSQLEEIAVKVKPQRSKSYTLRDQDDHIVLDCAIAARANYIITGDRDFLAYGQVAEIPVVTAQHFLKVCGGEIE